MKILHVVRGLRNSSGTTHIVGPLAEAQARQGADVSVYFVEQGAEEPVTPNAALVRSHRFPVSISLPAPNHAGISFPFASALRRTIETFDFVHIHAIWNFPTWYTMRTASRAGIPFMVAPQGSLEPWALSRPSRTRAIYARMAELPLMNRAAYMQALSVREAEQFRAAGVIAPVATVPNGIEPKNFEQPRKPLARRLDLAEGQRTVLSLSRLDPKKGIDVLIQGFGQFAATNRDVTLVIAGPDTVPGYGAMLRELAVRGGIADRTIFLGEVKGEDKYETLLGADAFALISHSEGLPVACLEAMAAGLPVIITPGCNLPEVAESGAGLIVEPHPDDVALAFRTLFDDGNRSTEMGKRARQLVNERFTWGRIAEQTLRLYERACQVRAGFAAPEAEKANATR